MNKSDFENRDIGEMVAVGACGPSWVRFWVRLTKDGLLSVELRSQHGEQSGKAELVPPADADGTLSFQYPEDVSGGTALEPVTAYRYRITRGNELVGEGRFETAPAAAKDAPARFSFAIASCHQPFDANGNVDSSALGLLKVLDRALPEHDVKRVFLMGDQMYADYPKNCSLFDRKSTCGPSAATTASSCRCAQRSSWMRWRRFWLRTTTSRCSCSSSACR